MSRNVKTTAAALARTNQPVHVAIDGLENAISGLGTSRDKRTFGDYFMPVVLNKQTLEAMYRTSWLAGKIVDVVADDMTREWITFNGDDEAGDKQRKALLEAEKRLGVRAKINEALKWARLYGGAVVILGTSDSVANGAAMMQPLNTDAVKRGDLRYLAILDRWRVSASSDLVTDLNDPAFGLPSHYLIAESSLRVHHSRVLRFNGTRLPYFAWTANARWDDSVLQRVFEKVRDADTVSGGIASMVFEANVDVVRLDGLADLLTQRDGEEKIRKRLTTALMGKSFNKALILDKDDEYEKKGNNFSGLSQVMQQVIIEVCGAADIPMTRLYGQSAKGLNATGDGDARNYYDMIRAKQQAELRAPLERLYRLIAVSEFGAVPENFEFEFVSLWQMSDTDRAALEYQRAQRDQIYVNMGAVPEHVVTGELLENGTYRNLTPEIVKMVEELGESGQLRVGGDPENSPETGKSDTGQETKTAGEPNEEPNDDDGEAGKDDK